MKNCEIDRKIPDQLAEAYREFTHGKYAKYKLQFPTLTQTNIASMIIKEWEGLSKKEKMSMKQQFISHDASKISSKSKNKYSTLTTQAKCSPDGNKTIQFYPSDNLIDYDDRGFQKQGIKNQHPKKKISNKQKQYKFHEQQQRQIDEKTKKQNEEFYNRDAYPHRVSMWDEESSRMNSQNIIDYKKKQIKKRDKRQERKKQLTINQRQYFTFSRYYFMQMKTAHPKWTNQQVRYIVQLLWKKRKMETRLEKIKSKNKKEENQITKNNDLQTKVKISGKTRYRQQKQLGGFSSAQIQGKEKKLPQQSKKHQKLKEKKGKQTTTPSNNFRHMKKSAIDFEKDLRLNNFEWMHQTIKH